MTLDAARELKPVYQDKFGLDWTKPDAGNCLQACLATVLGLSLDDVPHFVTREQHWDDMNRWLMKRFGLYVICFEDSEPWPWVQGYYLLSGQGARGAEHVVVYKDGKLAHDPIGPNGPGLEQIKNVWLFVAADPAAARASGSDALYEAIAEHVSYHKNADDLPAHALRACPEITAALSTPSPDADVVGEMREAFGAVNHLLEEIVSDHHAAKHPRDMDEPSWMLCPARLCVKAAELLLATNMIAARYDAAYASTTAEGEER